jgi:hypothetical protein
MELNVPPLFAKRGKEMSVVIDFKTKAEQLKNAKHRCAESREDVYGKYEETIFDWFEELNSVEDQRVESDMASDMFLSFLGGIAGLLAVMEPEHRYEIINNVIDDLQSRIYEILDNYGE